MFELPIKRKLQFMMVIPVLLIIIIVSVVNYVYAVVESRDSKNNWFHEVNHLVGQLYIVGYDVVMYTDEQRPRQQWEIIAGKISQYLKKHPFDQLHEEILVDELIKKQKKMSRLFLRMQTLKKTGINAAERRDQIARQVLLQTQTIRSEIYRALEQNERFYAEVRQQLILIIIIISFVLLLVIAFSFYYLYYSIVIPLDVLKKWSSSFSRGHLDKEIELDDSNEFRQLADNFFDLGYQLKQNHIELEDIKSHLQQAEVHSQLLLEHLDNCQIDRQCIAYLDWNIRQGMVYLTHQAIAMLGLEAGNNRIDLNQLINMFDFDNRQSFLYVMERCRDTGKSFEIKAQITTFAEARIEVQMNGELFTTGQHKFVTIAMIKRDNSGDNDDENT